MLYFSVDTFLKACSINVGGYVKPACFSNYFLEIMWAFGVAAVREHLSGNLQEIVHGKIVEIYNFAALSDTALAAFVHNVQANTLLAWNLSQYGQDTWRVTPQLTLTYGLRWDLNPALKGNNLENQPFTVIGLDDPATITLAPRGTPLYDTNHRNVAPRIGIAYQFGGNQNWTSVLRAGFGMFYDLGYGSLGGVSSYFPYQAVK